MASLGVAEVPSRRPCSYCGERVPPAVAACPACGAPREDGGDSDLGRPQRSEGARRKSRADLLFLVGLLVGGPVMTLGDRFQTGLFLVLAGGFSAVLRRYSRLSLTASVLIGGLGAGLVAAVAADSPTPSDVPALAVAALAAYVTELNIGAVANGGRVETRGSGLEGVWFLLPDWEDPGECGSVPDADTREHLASLGVQNIVVAGGIEAGGICSFEP